MPKASPKPPAKITRATASPTPASPTPATPSPTKRFYQTPLFYNIILGCIVFAIRLQFGTEWLWLIPVPLVSKPLFVKLSGLLIIAVPNLLSGLRTSYDPTSSWNQIGLDFLKAILQYFVIVWGLFCFFCMYSQDSWSQPVILSTFAAVFGALAPTVLYETAITNVGPLLTLIIALVSFFYSQAKPFYTAMMLISEPFEGPEYDLPRDSTSRGIDIVSKYAAQAKTPNHFLLLSGRKASGKTSLVRTALRGKTCVLEINKKLLDANERLDLEEIILKRLGCSPPYPNFEFLMELLNRQCLYDTGHILTIFLDIGIDQKTAFSFENVQAFGGVIGGFGRDFTYDAHVRKGTGFGFVVESSLSQPTDFITQKHGSICEKIHVPILDLKEFTEAYQMRFGKTFDRIIMPRCEKDVCPVNNYIAALEDWYYRLGSNLRDLEDVLKELEESGGGRDVFMGDIRRNHKLELHSIRTITPDELNFLKKVAKAGPAGCGFDPDTDEDNVQVSLLKRGPKDTIIYLRGHKVSMWRMSHVYYLLGMGKKEKPADKKGESTKSIHEQIVEEMEEYGWVGIKQ
eukprot:TRINITY_DN1184_c0_g1_i3.p1 TRINITY_DN1184_c0_g1~~TRINITY_DN1184_c0_g1_i3.p1  ORF type:complete len:571 (+),score=49.26 TRINITY_DN1184_c0_g1_i3:176-1888(+)